MTDPIRDLPRYLPPPFKDLDAVVMNEATKEVGYRWIRDGKVSYTWEFKDEKAAAKELARI